MKLILPVPPSVNGLYANVPGRGRVPTGRYMRWRDEALQSLWLQKFSAIEGQVEIVMTFPRKGRFDCSNRLKAPEDFLVTHGIIKDDDWRFVPKITSQVGDVEQCEIEITPLGG